MRDAATADTAAATLRELPFPFIARVVDAEHRHDVGRVEVTAVLVVQHVLRQLERAPQGALAGNDLDDARVRDVREGRVAHLHGLRGVGLEHERHHELVLALRLVGHHPEIRVQSELSEPHLTLGHVCFIDTCPRTVKLGFTPE